MLKGFKEFVAKGNVIDLAVGVIIGVAFGAVVDSLVADLIAPLLAMVVGKPDFSAIRLGPLGVGNFLNATMAFVLKAAALYFFIVVPFNKLKKATPAPAAGPTAQETLLTEIRDLLARR
jgi:large conductance mechanosensitive channel